jgi:ribosome-associated translation inhibitor RaiA
VSTKRTPLPKRLVLSEAKRGREVHATTDFPVHIRATGLPIDSADRAYVRRKLAVKLGKFGRAVERVSVRIDDVNGPRGGVDKVCTIKVVLAGTPSVVVAQHDTSLKAALDAAMQRAERTVRRAVQRRDPAESRANRSRARARAPVG